MTDLHVTLNGDSSIESKCLYIKIQSVAFIQFEEIFKYLLSIKLQAIEGSRFMLYDVIDP